MQDITFSLCAQSNSSLVLSACLFASLSPIIISSSTFPYHWVNSLFLSSSPWIKLNLPTHHSFQNITDSLIMILLYFRSSLVSKLVPVQVFIIISQSTFLIPSTYWLVSKDASFLESCLCRSLFCLFLLNLRFRNLLS